MNPRLLHLDADLLEAERRGISHASGAHEQCVRESSMPSFSVTCARPFSTSTRFTSALPYDVDAELGGHRLAERVADVVVEVREQAAARVDHRDADAESGEDARVLAADDAAANDDERRRECAGV